MLRRQITVLDLFSGIGGFTLGLERTGRFRTVGFCEIDKYCQQVLKQHWPNVPIFEDIHDITTYTLYQRNIRRIDVITAGFPCQPFSQAGKQQGTEDERFLWPELYRVIKLTRPRYIILENVPRLLTIQNGLIFAGILYDFRQIGYDVEWQVISAAAFGAWHLRKRLWIVAYPHCQWKPQSKRTIGKKRRRTRFLCREISLTASEGLQRPKRSVFEGQGNRLAAIRRRSIRANHWQTEPAICRVANGIPNRTHRIKALGNAVVPQIPQFIGECILEAM